jgi:hypothetical protein
MAHHLLRIDSSYQGDKSVSRPCEAGITPNRGTFVSAHKSGEPGSSASANFGDIRVTPVQRQAS